MSSLMIHLTDSMVAKINQIGRLRSPVEACGLILPHPRDGGGPESQIVELPNRTMEPSAYRIWVNDIKLEVNTDDPLYLEGLAIWHTHPEGNIGPSGSDMRKRREGINYLVVALREDGSAIPSWF